VSKVIKQVFENKTLSLHECADGFWLYDETQGMNIAMRAKTEQAAFIEALMYYQERLKKIENEHESLQQKVDSFLALFAEEED